MVAAFDSDSELSADAIEAIEMTAEMRCPPTTPTTRIATPTPKRNQLENRTAFALLMRTYRRASHAK
jgi:hypothetical protein